MSAGGANVFLLHLPVFKSGLYIVKRTSLWNEAFSHPFSAIMKVKENWPFCFRLTGLGHLCEFIEDCEHTVLATRILHLLGREGPRSQNPSKYIRFIYNRVILENAAVRAGKNVVHLSFSREMQDVTVVCFEDLFCLLHQTNYRFSWFLIICFHTGSFFFRSCCDISC